MKNPLTPIMDWRAVVRDGMKVTARVINNEIRGAITEKHVFHYKSSAESIRGLSDANQELNDLVVLSLVATFERTLRDFVMERGRILVIGDQIDEAIHAEIRTNIEYWRIVDRLIGICKGQIPPIHLGLVKQIVGYRNWVAHGRASAIPPDGNVAPKFAYEQLSRFLLDAGIIEPT